MHRGERTCIFDAKIRHKAWVAISNPFLSRLGIVSLRLLCLWLEISGTLGNLNLFIGSSIENVEHSLLKDADILTDVFLLEPCLFIFASVNFINLLATVKKERKGKCFLSPHCDSRELNKITNFESL